MIPLLLLLAVGVGQQPCSSGAPPKNDPNCIPAEQYIEQHAQPAPLKCGKYEHVDTTLAELCGAMSPAFRKKQQACNPSPHPICAPTMHPLKESEYQEMAQHIRDLERNLKAVVCGNMNYQGILSLDSGKTTTDCATLKPDMRRCKDLRNGLCFVENQPSPER